MYISKKKAKLLLRKNAGFSIAAADEEIEKLPKRKFGERFKVKLADVQKLIDEANKPTPVIVPKTGVKIRPFRKTIVDQIRQFKGLAVIK
jgi:hypothetical protein